MDKLKIVKSIVFILTFLLIFGTLLLLGQIYKKTRPQASATANSFSLEQPAGSSIADYKTDNGKILILVKNGGQSDRIIIFNPETGSNETIIHLNGNQNHD